MKWKKPLIVKLRVLSHVFKHLVSLYFLNDTDLVQIKVHWHSKIAYLVTPG